LENIEQGQVVFAQVLHQDHIGPPHRPVDLFQVVLATAFEQPPLAVIVIGAHHDKIVLADVKSAQAVTGCLFHGG
jgi:hypothetical protein